jgi:hypothetical protein
MMSEPMSRTSLSQTAHRPIPVDEDSATPSTQIFDSSPRPQIRARKSQIWVWAEHLLLLVLIVAFAVKGIVPAWRHLNSDFPNYYLVARLYRAGYPLERVYDWTWLQRQKDHQGIDQGLVSFIPSTLLSALAVAPWSSLPPLEAKHQWLILNLVLLLLTAVLLVRITNLGWERVALLMFLAFIPLRDNFLLGQMHVLVLFLLTLGAWLFFRDSGFLSGISLAMAAALKIFPGLFLIYFAWKRQWRAAIGLAVGLAGTALISIYLFGTDACLLYVRRVLPAGLRGETIDPYNPFWNSWTALVRRLFIAEPELNPAPVAHLPWLYALLQPLIHALIFVAFMWAISFKKSNKERTKLEWASFVFLLLFLSSQPGPYHFVALMLTAVLSVDYLLAHNRTTQAAIAVTIYALIGAPMIRFPWTTPAGWQDLLFFPRLALMCAFGGVLLWILVFQLPSIRLSLKNGYVPAAVVIVLTAIGFLSTQKHLRGQFDNYSARIATTPGNLLASAPVLSSTGIVFTAMTPTRYAIRGEVSGMPVHFAEGGSDWFHATASPVTNSLWAEQSTRNGSRVVRLNADSAGEAVIVATEAEDAQEPTVFPDSQFVAFLRPVKGRNSLWIRRISVTSPERRPIDTEEAHEVASEDYDVHEATFLPDHRLIFSSNRSRRFALYIATPSGAAKNTVGNVVENIDELKKPTCSARYPAISPDGKWLAFTCEEGDATQIHVADLNGNHDLRLTSGDCNSISPAWTLDSKRLVYATDCGRGLGLTALAQVTVFH